MNNDLVIFSERANHGKNLSLNMALKLIKNSKFLYFHKILIIKSFNYNLFLTNLI